MSDDVKTAEFGKIVTVKVDDLKPYENNPRNITVEGVQGVEHSIREYGMVQPIVISPDYVVLAGHTRLEAMKKMGKTEVPAIFADIDEKSQREYRLVDNKTGEMADWDYGALVIELREFDAGLIEEFFPNIDLAVEKAQADVVTDDTIAKVEDKVLKIQAGNEMNEHTTKVICPDCDHGFGVRTKSLPGITWSDLKTIVFGE